LWNWYEDRLGYLDALHSISHRCSWHMLSKLASLHFLLAVSRVLVGYPVYRVSCASGRKRNDECREGDGWAYCCHSYVAFMLKTQDWTTESLAWLLYSGLSTCCWK
jgi:hypothetical protein